MTGAPSRVGLDTTSVEGAPPSLTDFLVIELLREWGDSVSRSGEIYVSVFRGSPTALTIRFSEFDHNGTAEFKGTYGGVKAAATSNGGEMYIFDSYAHDNVGIGFWGDRCQEVMVVKDSLATDNSRDGIKWETNMSAGGCSNTDTRWARIQHNTALRNGDGTNADGNIKIRNSPNADVSFNVTGSGSNWGVKLIDTGVHGAFFNNQVHQNVTPDGIDHCSVTGVTCSKNTT